MHKLTTRLIISLLTFILGIAATTAWYFNRPSANQEVRLETPNAEWQPSFFNALESRTKDVNLPSLRTAQFPEHDLEVRFWYDSRPDVINGFVIRRLGGKWSAVGIRQIYDREQSPVKLEALGSPKSGWDATWQRLISAGILTLPDGSKLKCSSGVLDGGAYVVETNVNGIYRTYRYDNPQFAECDEAKRIVLIEAIIADEFFGHDSQN